eukprot:1373890-Pyramimonas_sp.AAC.1
MAQSHRRARRQLMTKKSAHLQRLAQRVMAAQAPPLLILLPAGVAVLVAPPVPEPASAPTALWMAHRACQTHLARYWAAPVPDNLLRGTSAAN